MTGEQLEKAREMMGLTRAELASTLGMTYSGIFSWETNGHATEELKPWVPLALAGMNPGVFKVIDGEIYIKLGVKNDRKNQSDSGSVQEGQEPPSSG